MQTKKNTIKFTPDIHSVEILEEKIKGDKFTRKKKWDKGEKF